MIIEDITTMSLIEYSVDLEQQTEPQPLPVNTYPGSIESAEVKQTKDGSGEYLSLGIRISTDAYPADYADGDPDGTLMYFNRTPVADAPRARWLMKRLRTACGLPTRGRTIDPYDFVGLTVNVAVEHNEWEGERRAQIARVVGAG